MNSESVQSDLKNDEEFYKKYRILNGGFSHLLDRQYDVLKNAKVSFPIEGEENDVFFVENLLSTKECNDLIKYANTEGFFPVDGFTEDIRNNARRRTRDPDMSEIMLERLKNFMPLKTIVMDDCRWDLHRFLDYWRYLRYNHSQQFRTHYDGSKKLMDEQRDIFEMTVYTLNCYLNDGFEGGGTRFYMNCKDNAKVYDDEEAGPVTHVIHPKEASALVFNHCNKGYLHDGEPLNVENTKVKEKYLLRADLIYRLREEDVPKLKKKIQEGSTRFWNTEFAKKGIVEDFVGNTWKCACVAPH